LSAEGGLVHILSLSHTTAEKGIQLRIKVGDKKEFSDACAWWRSNEHRFPTCGRIARMNLAPFGATVSQEGTFNVTGAIASKARATIGDESLSNLVYFNRTYESSISALSTLPGLGYLAGNMSALHKMVEVEDGADPDEVEARRARMASDVEDAKLGERLRAAIEIAGRQEREQE
jgi:hypothetical protein